MSILGVWNQNTSAKPFLLVSVSGPTDGGDYGPATPGSTTNGFKEAFTKAASTRQPVFSYGDISWPNTVTVQNAYLFWQHYGTITLQAPMVNAGDATHGVRALDLSVQSISGNGNTPWTIKNAQESTFRCVVATGKGTENYVTYDDSVSGSPSINNNNFYYQTLTGFYQHFRFQNQGHSGLMQGATLIGGMMFGMSGAGMTSGQTGIVFDSGVNAGLGALLGQGMDLHGGPTGSLDYNDGGKLGGGWTIVAGFVNTPTSASAGNYATGDNLLVAGKLYLGFIGTLDQDNSTATVLRATQSGSATANTLSIQAQMNLNSFKVGNGVSPKVVQSFNNVLDDGNGQLTARNSLVVTLSGTGGTERGRLEVGTSGNAGALKLFDAGAGAFRWLAISGGSVIVLTSEPT